VNHELEPFREQGLKHEPELATAILCRRVGLDSIYPGSSLDVESVAQQRLSGDDIPHRDVVCDSNQQRQRSGRAYSTTR
jgi:hypothetical protein